MTLALAAAPACSDDDPPDAPTGGTGGVGTGGGATGGAPTTGGNGGAPPAGDPTAQFVESGLGTVGEWSGFLWTAASDASSIMPNEFTGETICASGTVGAGFEEWAMIGWNLNQEVDPVTGAGSETLGTITPQGSTLKVEVENRGTSELRVQIQTSDQPDADRWCAPIPEDGLIAWTDFNTKCWDGTGDAYDGTTPIAQMAIQTPAGSATAETPFDYCWIDVSEQ